MVTRVIIGVILGAVAGFALGSLRTCSDGGCPLTSSPWSGAVYGALIGLLTALSG